MRVIVNCSGLLVALALIILIHTSIVSRNVRDEEINHGIELSADYAFDKMMDMYDDMDYEADKEDDYTEQLVNCFCKSMSDSIGSDGTINIGVIAADIKTGTFDFVIEEIYDYTFKGRKGVSRCERAVTFGN